MQKPKYKKLIRISPWNLLKKIRILKFNRSKWRSLRLRLTSLIRSFTRLRIRWYHKPSYIRQFGTRRQKFFDITKTRLPRTKEPIKMSRSYSFRLKNRKAYKVIFDSYIKVKKILKDYKISNNEDSKRFVATFFFKPCFVLTRILSTVINSHDPHFFRQMLLRRQTAVNGKTRLHDGIIKIGSIVHFNDIFWNNHKKLDYNIGSFLELDYYSRQIVILGDFLGDNLTSHALYNKYFRTKRYEWK
jgi:hypothetical protein